MKDTPPWLELPLDALTDEQWESLCDGCALCCLHKVEDVDSGDIHYTAVACKLLDIKTCRCTDYDNRLARVPACVDLVPDRGQDLLSLPPSCAYRRRYLGQALATWHPLVSGDPESVHRAKISIRDRAVSERDVGEPDEDGPWLEDFPD